MAGGTATVTFLFVDLVGSTDLLHRIGDDANDELTRRYQALMREAVERHGGDVLRTMGDGLTVVFEQSVGAAVACAVDMQRSIDRMGRADPLLRLQIRVGLSVGEASRMQGDWSGTPIFEAARLESKARPGTILVNDVIRVLLGNRGGFEFTPVGALELKGFPEPLPAAEVAWAPDPGRLEVPLAPALELGLSWPMVGRTTELGQLETLWRTVAGGDGGGRLVAIVGEPGVGKTRLAAELGARVQRGASGDEGVPLGTVLYGAAEDVGASALAPLAEALRWWAASVTPDRLREIVGDDAAVLAALVPSLGVRLPELVGGAVAVDIDEVATTVVEILRRATASGPMLMVVDAAHAADDATVALVTEVVAAGLPILWLALARVPAGLAAPTATATAPTIELGGLDPFDVQDLLAEVVSRQGFTGEDVSSEVARDVHRETRGNPRMVIETGERLAVSGALGAGPPEARAQAVRLAVAGASPYKGLLAFQAEDADDFFGRDDDIAGLLGRVAAGRLLAVVGASGSGKSSLVRAGLLPALRRGALAGSEAWPVVLFNAGPRPLLELAAGLAAALDARAGVVMNTLESSVTGLDDVIVEAFGATGADPARASGPGRVAIVVDQFEEVFTACSDEAERDRFAETLLHAASVPGGRALVVLVMRADFYGHCAGLPGLASPLESNNVLLGPMAEASLRAVIEDPARRAGLSIESGLVDVMIHDVVGEPGALPLLSHALYETWERREHRTLTVGGYRDAGGARGAIARTAEDVYANRLDAEQQTLARDLFLRLTELGEGTEDTRRRVERAELVDRATREAALDQVLEVLVAARLVTADDETVEVAHEALIREWPRLRDWLDEDRESLRTLRGLDRAATEWDHGGRDPADLYRGARLVAALDATSHGALSLTAVEAAFLDASRDAEEAERRAADERAAEQARQNRRLRRLLAGVGVLLVLALIAGLVAYQQRSTASRQRDRADQRTADADFQRLVSQSVNVLASDRSLGFLLALEANRERDDAESRSTLFTTLQREQDFLGYTPTPAGVPTGATLVGDTTLAYTTQDAEFGLAAVDTGRPGPDPVALGPRPEGEVQVFVADDPDRGRRDPVVAARADTGAIYRVDPRSLEMAGNPIENDQAVLSLAASSRLGLIAAGREDGTVALFDFATGEQVGELPAQADPTQLGAAPSASSGAVAGDGDPVALAFSPTDREAAVERPDGVVEFWDIDDDHLDRASARAAPASGTAGFGELVFRADGAQVVAFNPASAAAYRAIDTQTADVEWAVGLGQTVARIAYSPDGSSVFTVDEGGDIVERSVQTGAGRRTISRTDVGSPASLDLAEADGSSFVVLTSEAAKIAASFTLDGNTSVLRSFGTAGQYVDDLSPDGRRVAIGLSNYPEAEDAFSIWAPKTGDVLIPELAFPQGTFGLRLGPFTSDTTIIQLYADTDARYLQAYDVERRRALPPPTPFPDDATSLIPNGDAAAGRVSFGHVDGRVDLFDGNELLADAGIQVDSTLWQVRLSLDGTRVAAVTDTEVLSVFEVPGGEPITDPIPDVAAATFADDPNRMFLASSDSGLREVDLTTGDTVGAPFSDLSAPALDVSVSDDGRTLVTTDQRNIARVYDVASRRQIGEDMVMGDVDAPASALVAHDGTFLVASAPDGMNTWDLVPDHWRDAACRLAGRNLTQEEWDTYLPNAGAYRKTCEEWPAGS